MTTEPQPTNDLEALAAKARALYVKLFLANPKDQDACLAGDFDELDAMEDILTALRTIAAPTLLEEFEREHPATLWSDRERMLFHQGAKQFHDWIAKREVKS